MNREQIIKKAMTKLSKAVGKIPEDKLEDHMNRMNRVLRTIKKDDLEGPKLFLKLFGEMIDREGYEKEEVQELLAKAKQMGMIKKSLNANKFMERAWRAIIKIYKLQGFMLEN